MFALTPRLAFAAAPTDARFVFIILRGAMDGMSAVMPVGDPHYAALRGALAHPPGEAQPVKLDAIFALHPAMPRFAAMYADKQALVVHAVASPYRERSHFDAQNVLETGGTAAYALKDGWLNRLVAALPAGRDPAIAIAATVPMALRGPAPVTSLRTVGAARRRTTTSSTGSTAYTSTTPSSIRYGPRRWTRGRSRRAAAATRAQANPAALGKLAAKFLSQPNGPRIAVIELLGWDTHAQQAGRLAQSAAGSSTRCSAR